MYKTVNQGVTIRVVVKERRYYNLSGDRLLGNMLIKFRTRHIIILADGEGLEVKRIDKIFNELSLRLLPAADALKEQVNEDLFETAEWARQEWVAACSFFDSVSDPDLIDHAIYAMSATEKKYLYLLKKARDAGYHATMGGTENK